MRFHIWAILLSLLISLSIVVPSLSQQGACTPQGPYCAEGYCCSIYGYCGNTGLYCDPGNCQSQCPTPSPPPPPVGPTPSPPPPVGPTPSPPPPVGPTPPSPSGGDLTDLIPKETFEYMLRYRNDLRCYAVGFYTYEAFITAARFYPEFGNTGDIETRKREITAFFGQTSHETTGGWPTADGGPYAWGYCYLTEVGEPVLCDESSGRWPCYPGKRYFGRGPMQLSWNYNYGQCGADLGMPLLQDPDLVSADPVNAFKAALWFWMTPQAPKPSSHDVIVGQWVPTSCDISANRLPGYGVITNIINGGLECKGRAPGQELKEADRIGFYQTYCDLLGVGHGENIDCANQTPFNQGCGSVASI